MKITICGSIAFINEMYQLKERLEQRGHEVQAPPNVHKDQNGKEIPALEYYAYKKTLPMADDWFWTQHDQRIRDHFKKVAWSDVIVVANHDKNEISGYIGPNTLMEMGLAFYLKKPIYALKKLPIGVSWREEILGMKPIVIHEDISLINL